MLWRGTTPAKFFTRFNALLFFLMLIAEMIVICLAEFTSDCLTKVVINPTDITAISSNKCGLDDLDIYYTFCIIGLISKAAFLKKVCSYLGKSDKAVDD